jgi:hypothetical protein
VEEKLAVKKARRRRLVEEAKAREKGKKRVVN